jgi:3-deoxy-D-manno-octulosonic-acid transferase
MTWFFYNVLFAIGFLLMTPRFLLRMRRRGGYARNFSQRFGRYADDVRRRLAEGPRVWVHAVSVGELYVALKLMEAWRAAHPGTRFVVTTTTSTGRAIADGRIGDPDVVLYFPLDFPWTMRRAFDAIRPAAVMLVELELWPNLVRLAQRRSIPVFLVNGRISDHSFQGYRRLRFFTSRILPLMRGMFAQSGADAERLVSLGAPRDRVRSMGSAKYDVASADPDGARKARAVLRDAGLPDDAVILLGGSTWPGEEEALLDAYRALKPRHPRLALVLAPRHVERVPSILPVIGERGLEVRRRSLPASDAGRPDVLLIDTTGELKNFYACADVIFVGKSLTQHGGQNVIEPALYGKPVVVGPNMENFAAIVEDFRQASALVQVGGPDALAGAIESLLSDPARMAVMGRRAADVVEKNRGAVRHTIEAIDRMLAAG